MTRSSGNSLQEQLIECAFLLPFWVLVTAWLGGVCVWKLVAWYRRRGLRGRELARCARGHAVPLYGVYECACGSIHEGRVFGLCRVCSETCGWTPCPACGLPILNPELGR